jgi:DNA-3-methyladenine glycosylase II
MNKFFSSGADPVLKALHRKVEKQLGSLPVIQSSQPEQYFASLAESIVSQQLSTKVADVIFGRVKQLAGKNFSPKKLLKISVENLRRAGLSYSKASYMQNIARAWEEGLVNPRTLQSLEDEAVIEQLVQIKGIGRWTAEMFLIFTLGRPNVFSVGDYGLRKAISIAYKLPIESKPAIFLELSKRWSPHKSLASRILWKSLEL